MGGGRGGGELEKPQFSTLVLKWMILKNAMVVSFSKLDKSQELREATL